MKKVHLLALSLIVIFSACKKYEEGPRFSFRSKEERLSNSWVISKVFESANGGSKTDKTSDYHTRYSNFVLVCDKENHYSTTFNSFSTIPANEVGRYHFGSEKNIIIFDYQSGNDDTMEGKWTILRLKEDELWMETVDSNTNVTVEVHFTPQ